jgi:hypothetical protein
MVTVFINGIEYKARADFEIAEKAGNKTSSGFTVVIGDGQPVPAAGDIIECLDDTTGEKLFYGTCGIPKSPKYTSLFTDVREYSITCGNGNSILDNRIANVAMQNKTITEIVNTLFTLYIAAEGITLGVVSNITATMSVYTASDFNLRDCLNELANSVNAVWEITPDRVFNFIVWDDFPSFPYTINENFLLGTELQHSTRSYNLRTVQIVSGATDTTDPQTENFIYDGEQKTFSTSYPIDSKPQIWVDEVEVPQNKIGVKGFDDSNDNMVFLFSYRSQEVSYVERTEFLTAGDRVTITYIGIFSIRTIVSNQAKIAEIAAKTGTSGVIERMQLAYNIRSTADAINLGLSLLSQFEEKEGQITFWLTSAQLRDYDLTLSDTNLLTMFRFDLGEFGMSGEYVISERKITPILIDLDDNTPHEFKISLKLADRNILKSYGQVIRDLEKDVTQLAIRPDEIVVSAEFINETERLSERMNTYRDLAYYVCEYIYQGSMVAPMDFGNPIYPLIRRMHMQQIENIKSSGLYTIKAFEANTKELRGLWLYKNLLTKINRDLRIAMLMGTAIDAGYTVDMMQIKYFAFGTGTTPATVNDTQLVDEQYRKAVTQTTQVDASTIQTIVNLLAEEANFVIREIGVFCGPTATSDPNSGVMLSRVNVVIDKNSNLVINIVRQDITII